MSGLLDGVRVLDATTIVLGPYAGRTLADLGANVIKLESPDGDLFRQAGPMRSPGMGSGYMNANLGKRSVALDLKRPEAYPARDALLGWADVVLHNMRPRAAKKVGLDWESVSAVNPQAIYCWSCGWGSEGPNADAPAYDDVLQGASGFAALNGDGAGAPRYTPTIICDKVTGLHLAIAALSGLVHRGRTGRGCRIEAPMMESMTSFLLMEHLGGHTFDPAQGGAGYPRLMATTRKPWRTQDGYIAALPYTTRQWQGFFTLGGREDLAGAAWIGDPVARAARAEELYGLAESLTPAQTSAWWLAALREREVPCAPVQTMDDLVLRDAHLQAVGMVESYDHPTEGALRRVRSPLRVGGGAAPAAAPLPAPRLGEHGRSVLRDAGMDAAAIEALARSGALVGA